MPFRPYDREQEWLLPPSLSELIPEDHPARFVLDFVSMLDWRDCDITIEPPVLGAPAYAPEVLLAAWLYGFMVRVRTSRKLERACQENIVFMWLTGLQRPDHSTLSRFYRRNRQAMRPLLKQTVHLAMRVGLVDFAFQAVDGTRLASAARQSLHSRARTEELLQQVEREIATMEAANAQEDSPDGAPPRGPQGRLGRKEVRERLRQALAELDSRAARPGGRHDADAISRSDPEAALMKAAHGYVVGYNAQTVVDGRSQIVVAAEVTACASDGEQLVPMLAEARAMTGRTAEAVAADSGYFAIGSIVEAEQRGGEVFVPVPEQRKGSERERYAKAQFRYEAEQDRYICPEGKALPFWQEERTHHGKPLAIRVYRGRECRGCPAQQSGACTRGAGRRVERYATDEVRARFVAKMKTERAREMLRKRAATAEPVYASTKERLGVVRFLRRGLENVRAEWRFTCAAHNLLKTWRYWWHPRFQVVTCPG